MKKFKHEIVFLAVIIITLQLVACQKPKSNYEKIEPSHTEHIENSELSKLTLTKRAIERLSIETATVTEELLANSFGGQNLKKVTPYASVIYDANGLVWVYTNPEPMVYIRHKIEIDFIRGDKAYLLEGPSVGTVVATQGAAELYGTEYNIGH
ncbi:MAG: hypothetical protein KAK04_20720 [Cyclobacteriaceae bacterium]|nr:hypothetical protein [Cyclobacteriaceae bacterium]